MTLVARRKPSSSGVAAVPEAPMSNWYALTIKPQAEVTARLALEYRGFATLLPLYRERRRWSDRWKTIERPIFPGYLFCRFDPDQRREVMTAPGVRSVVGFGAAFERVPDEQILAIETAVASHLPLSPWDYLTEGERVRIAEGPLAGMEGILADLKDSVRVVVSVELLKRSLAVEVDRQAVRPVVARPLLARPAYSSGAC